MSQSKTVSVSAQSRETFQPSWRAQTAVVVAIAATYGYFLIFAQFGFLKAVQAVVGGEGALLRPLMAVMGGCGIAGSIAVVRIYAAGRGRWLMLLGFGLGGAAAGLSLLAGSSAGLMICAALTGVGTGIITVTLAAMVRREVGGEKLGWCIGAGTGLAYGLCNLPFVFNAGAAGQAVMGIVACGAGALAVLGFRQRAPQHEVGGFDYRPGGVGGWVVILFALVWLDSAAFYVIQHTPALKGGMWGGDAQLYLNAIVHAAAALLAGLMLDRRWVGRTVLFAAGWLIMACILIRSGEGALATGAFCYTTGVSFYSTVLVFYVARSGRVGLAALVYSVAGWIGSALGIGMAENLGAVPAWFLIGASALVLGGISGRCWLQSRDPRVELGGGEGAQ